MLTYKSCKIDRFSPLSGSQSLSSSFFWDLMIKKKIEERKNETPLSSSLCQGLFDQFLFSAEGFLPQHLAWVSWLFISASGSLWGDWRCPGRTVVFILLLELLEEQKGLTSAFSASEFPCEVLNRDETKCTHTWVSVCEHLCEPCLDSPRKCYVCPSVSHALQETKFLLLFLCKGAALVLAASVENKYLFHK